MAIDSQSRELLSLAQASKLLGVHTSTLRRWADQGDVRVKLTPGGHRRFPRSEIEKMVYVTEGDQDRVGSTLVARATALVRQRITAVEGEEWISVFDSEERLELVAIGRSVLALLSHYLDDSGSTKTRRRLVSLGQACASRARNAGLSFREASRAISFFRDTTLEAVIPDGVENCDPASIRMQIRAVTSFFGVLADLVHDQYNLGQ